jgi:hypothetical protein
MNAKSNTIQPGIVYGYTRWSTERQSWGDAERRQERAAQEWCQRNNRILADTRFADKGVSDWRGDNRKSGRLRDLLKVVQPGDTILIEDDTGLVLGVAVLPLELEKICTNTWSSKESTLGRIDWVVEQYSRKHSEWVNKMLSAGVDRRTIGQTRLYFMGYDNTKKVFFWRVMRS